MDSRQTLLEDDYYLHGLGIVIPGKKYFKNKGFIKLYTEDFIVEEVTNDGNFVDINSNKQNDIPNPEEKQNFKATLVQKNTGTLEVVKKVSKLLNIPETNIQYAGIKDNDALTAQKITIQGVSLNDLNSVKSDSFYFKDIEVSDQKIKIGELEGNRFTLLVRLDKTSTDSEELKNNIEKIQNEGFYNFYYSQRFGTLGRDNNHTLARLAIQKKYSEALHKFLTESPKTCFKFMTPIFKEVEENYGNWQKIREIFQRHPQHFEKEIEIVDYLIQNPEDHLGAISKEIRFWMLGFASWLFNIKLSNNIIKGENIPNKIDLITSNNKNVIEKYRYELNLVGLENFDINHLEKFNIQKANFPIETKKQVIFDEIKFVDAGVILKFRLDKGSYATTVLAHCLDLIVGDIPDNFSKDKLI